MKRFWALLTFILLFSLSGIIYSHQSEKGKQMSEYKQEWEQVASFQQQGLPKSALEVVKKIYGWAKRENNSGQIVKALVYQMHLQESFEEEGLKKNIERTVAEVEESEFPVKPILQSMLASMYWQYYQNNRYQLLDRSETSGASDADIATWSAGQFAAQAIQLYRASLENSDQLQELPMRRFDAITEAAEGSRKFRPTLYDLLAHRALDFFMHDEADLTKPVYEFRLNHLAFLPAEDFVKHQFETRDTLSFKYHALTVFQELLRFHLKDKTPDALVDADLKRLSFARDNAVGNDTDARYLKALEALEKECIRHEISTWVTYQIANYHFSQGGRFSPGADDTYQWAYKKAYDICATGLKRFPDSDGAKNCRALQSRILTPQLSIEMEQVNLPEKPFRALVTHRNVRTVYLRAIPLTPEQLQQVRENNRFNNEQWHDFYLQQDPTTEWSVDLPDEDDYQRHLVEIKMPSLPAGHYIIMMSPNEAFTFGEGVATGTTWISNLAYMTKSKNYAPTGVYVFDRTSGKPLSKATVQTWITERNRGRSKEVKGSLFKTDKNGYCDLSKLNRNKHRRYRLDIRHNDERLFLDDYFNAPRDARRVRNKARKRTFFFTDRSIYRPGQTIYFKGITLETDDKKNSIVTDHKTTVTFFDANHQKVTSLDLVTNEYGTFSGSFTAPQGGLTGYMSIRNENGNHSISVEEYKRPTFEVTFQPLSGSFKLGETVSVTGTAKAYSGANIDNASVQYRVVRQPRFPYWWGFWRWGGHNYNDTEILNGTATTDETGNVTIEFIAAPDSTIPETRQPEFDYRVYLDVTDLGGETRSAQTSVKVGYVALSVRLDLPESINIAKMPAINIITENLNGEFEAASGTVTVYPLENPGRVFRSRLWSRPDQFIMNKDDYYRDFPYDIYKDEDDFRNWENGNALLTHNFNTAEAKTMALQDAAEWKQGKYLAELKTSDKFGKEIVLKKFFTLYDSKEKKVPDHAFFWDADEKLHGEPGEEAIYNWGSAAGDVRALLEVYRQDQETTSRWIKAGDKKQRLTLPIRESDRGNLGFSLFFVKYGRVQQISRTVRVPWTNKDLKIRYETFRDKLKPGQPEEWRLTLSGPKGEKVAAEMLAGMYDASLDAFRNHNWYFNIYRSESWSHHNRFNTGNAFAAKTFRAGGRNWHQTGSFITRQYDQLLLYRSGNFGRMMRKGSGGVMMRDNVRTYSMAEAPADAAPEAAMAIEGEAMMMDADQSISRSETPPPPAEETNQETEADDIPVRRNLNETAFFFPHLATNAEGEIVLSFTMPEALTRWKFLGFAHTKELQFALTQQTIVTQKELMVVPNAPRFFREGDEIVFSGKVSNLTEETLNGNATLQLFDALSMQPLDAQLGNNNAEVSFSAAAGQSAPLRWALKIPDGIQAVTYRIVASAGDFSDGEENMLPVLTNRMLVIESLPLPIRGNESKTYKFEKLLDSGKSETLRHQNVSLEFTSNPAWYAIQALPYMMEYPYECAEQIFSRYYANSIASHIANANPKIKRVFDVWRQGDGNALLSNLEKNQELKSLLLEETPWVLQAQDESERKKRVALLFDLNKMASEQSGALRKLQQMQHNDGGWSWFPEMDPSRYITTHIVSGLGHLDRLDITEIRGNQTVFEMLKRAVAFLDRDMQENYERLLRNKADLKKQQIGNAMVQYLYARSYFPEISVEDNHKTAYDFWQSQAKEYWLSFNKYTQGMIALALHRSDEKEVPAAIVKSLREHALQSEEFGMYWKENSGGYYWYQAPIETQALLIEVFDEVADDRAAVEEMRIWLLKQKQTQDWKTTKATAEACYALLLRGSDLLASDALVTVTVGNETIDPANMDDVKVEAGTGYFKTSWPGKAVTPEMGNVTVEKKDDGVAWGALYWQYFEQLDKITTHETPLKLEKQLFRQENTASGPVLKPINEGAKLQPGDLLKVRIELRVDRNMEYVHMKDMRAAGFEPINVLSGYRYSSGLGYYESTRDASTNFFFSYLNKGTYVFEYPLRVTHEGGFSNGITTIQCMYAPEFTSHSEGIRVTVE